MNWQHPAQDSAETFLPQPPRTVQQLGYANVAVPTNYRIAPSQPTVLHSYVQPHIQKFDITALSSLTQVQKGITTLQLQQQAFYHQGRYHASMETHCNTEHCVKSNTRSRGYCLYFLEKYTSGPPKELVLSCQHMAPDVGYDEARKLLKQNFGIVSQQLIWAKH